MHFCLDVVNSVPVGEEIPKGRCTGTYEKQGTKDVEKRQKKQEQADLQQENKRLSEENYRLRMRMIT